MTPHYWEKIETLFHRAMEREAGQRAAFLAEACPDDEGLRREVQSLLAAQEDEAFLVAPACEIAARGLAQPPESALENPEVPSSPTPPDRRHPFFWFVMITGAVVALFFLWSATVVWRYGGKSKERGWTNSYQNGAQYVAGVDPRGPAAGKLKAGDRLMAVNGDTTASRLGPYPQLLRIPPGTDYRVRVRRGSEVLELTLKQTVASDSRQLAYTISLLLVAFVYSVFFFVGAVKPSQLQARLLCLLCLCGAMPWVRLTVSPMVGLLPAWEVSLAVLALMPSRFQFPLAYHLCYRFPPGAPKGRWWSAVLWGSYVYTFADWCVVHLRDLSLLGLAWATAAYFRYWDAMRSFNRAPGLAIVLVLACAVAIRNYRLTGTADKRRVKWTLFGLLGAAFFIILSDVVPLVLNAVGYRGYSGSAAQFYLDWTMLVAVVAVPLSFAYAILRHQVLDIRVAIRRGTQYLLAKNGLRLLLAAPVCALLWSILSHPDRTLGEILFRNSAYFYMLLIAALATALPHRGRLSAWVDRKFFHEAYNRENMLMQLAEEVRNLDSLPDVSARISSQLAAALHPEPICLFYREDAQTALVLGYSSGDHPRNLAIPEDFRLLRFLEDQGGAQEFPFPPKNSLPTREKAFLNRLGARLLVPMLDAGGRLAGLLVLGAKKSEDPYSAADRKLLEALAGQVALVCENIRLRDHVARDRKIQRDVLARLGDRQIHPLKECPLCGACYDSAAEVCAADGQALTLPSPVERVIDGKYRLDRLLGRGGMGRVYEAQDLRMARKVAIKVLVGSMFGDARALQRFAREARAAARLNHPNVVAVYDYGEIQAAAGGAYLVMELAPGFTLRDRLQRSRRLTPDVAAELFDAVLKGVAAAHREGITHRDLKPENILVPHGPGSGAVKILDFGLARLVGEAQLPEETLTAQGAVLGTLGYMAPEQLRGERVDERTDIFALGVMVFEALAGQRPFQGRTPLELLASIERPVSAIEGVSRSLVPILQKCMRSDPAGRFTSVAELQQELIPELRRCATESPAGGEMLPPGVSAGLEDVPAQPVVQPNGRARSRLAAAALAGVVLALSGATAAWRTYRPGTRLDSIAVLPFVNMSGDAGDEYFSDGMTEELTDALANVPGLRVIARTSAFAFKGKRQDIREIGRALRVSGLIEGSVRRSGDRLRVTVQLVRAADGSRFWSHTYERQASDAFAVQDEISQGILRNLQAAGGAAIQPIAMRRGNPEAYDLYLRGHHLLLRGGPQGLQQAREYFEQAVRIAPDYALAYAGLADYFQRAAEFQKIPVRDAIPQVHRAALRAMALDQNLAEPHVSLGNVLFQQEWNWAAAEREFQRALQLDRSNVVAHLRYSDLLRLRGRVQEGEAELKRALELDPLSLDVNGQWAWVLFQMRRYNECIEQCRKTSEIDPSFWRAHYVRGYAYAHTGRFPEALAEADQIEAGGGQPQWPLVLRGYAYAHAGRTREALAMVDAIKALPPDAGGLRHLPILYAALGDRRQMCHWLSVEYEERAGYFWVLGIDPVFDSVRQEPCFTEVVKKIGLPQ